MLNEYIRYRIPADQTTAFLDAYSEASKSLQASRHCLGYELSRCTEAPECFILRIHWDSSDGHLKGFRTEPEFPPFFKAVRPFVPNIEEMRHYELTSLRWDRAASS